MARTIGNPTDYKIHTAIRYLKARDLKADEIHRQISEVYGANFMSDGIVRKWLEHLMMGFQVMGCVVRHWFETFTSRVL
ncbi:hypothetical protein CEXT_559121 [Caerostris extrusa]|uniref:Mos1 transposase HTH domain-containing protein n=1 Tax=Caerostris extrusa TaxID=172846 RepID=A0AAV4VEM4_CAEEX|nr:hypothetical protein CEXT_559121 [Caerostris extrusa]